jgi:hypothetical protein
MLYPLSYWGRKHTSSEGYEIHLRSMNKRLCGTRSALARSSLQHWTFALTHSRKFKWSTLDAPIRVGDLADGAEIDEGVGDAFFDVALPDHAITILLPRPTNRMDKLMALWRRSIGVAASLIGPMRTSLWKACWIDEIRDRAPS